MISTATKLFAKKIRSAARFAIAALSRKHSHSVSHKFNLFLATALLVALPIAFLSAGLIEAEKPAIYKDEYDLSGPWKISFSDSPENSSTAIDDSNWCETGVPDPALSKPNKRKNCEATTYPAEKMRGATYWYRKNVEISADAKWDEPSLFLGAIKHKAWIYWDGKLVKITNMKHGLPLVNVLLEQNQVEPGPHLLAIRVQSLNTRYPGIFHAFPRKVTLGNSAGDSSQFTRIIREKYIFPSINIFVQTSGLLLTLLLIVLGRGASQEFVWISIYFFGSALGNISHLAPTELHQFFARIGMISTGFAVLGYGLKFHNWNKNQILFISRLIMTAMIGFVSVYTLLFYQGLDLGQHGFKLAVASAIFPFVFFTFGISHRFLKRQAAGSVRMPRDKVASIVILFFLHSLNVTNEILLFSIPHVFDHPALKSILSLTLLATMIYQYTEQERTLAFFGRFIRPGLKSLLHEKAGESHFGDSKIFRPRKIAIMKVDIVGHTESTFQMPYGMKRLFQDIWFTTIDQVVADRVFLDKNVGDGSIYCFSENHTDGACMSALVAAKQIRNHAIAEFDRQFNQKISALIEATDELQAPAESFFLSYKQRTGTEFWKRKTKVRIALVYGYVDEGLWGLTSQSHYDVQGDLVSLAARIESKALDNEVLLSEDFVKQLEEIDAKIKLSPRKVSLKGMGEMTVYSYDLDGLNKKAA